MADAEAARSRLIEIVKARSLHTGAAITLASGKTSTFYINLKPTMMDAEGAHLLALLILDELRDANVDLVGGMEMGAVPLAACVVAASHTRGPRLRAFFVRKQAKDHGTRSLVEGLADGETLAGKRIAMLEDVTTTGGSTMRAMQALQAEGAIIDRVIVIVDRQEGAAEAFRAAGIPFVALLTAADFQ
jgi:orotate phosphoribosyltransferase